MKRISFLLFALAVAAGCSSSTESSEGSDLDSNEAEIIKKPKLACSDVGGQCIVTRPVTVEYPFTYSAIGALAAYFGGGGFTRSGLQATASMRSELSAGACS